MINDVLSSWGNKPIIVGIINATPDSFFDGGQALTAKGIHQKLVDCEGADVIDIGAESSKPGADPIGADEEIRRLSQILPIVRNQSSAVISVDTYRTETAAYALENGAQIINDISGGSSEDLLRVVSEYKAGLILMHKQGQPKTMQHQPNYTNVVLEIKHYLKQRIVKATDMGIHSVIIDPGIGFGKTLTHNCSLLRELGQLTSLQCPIMIGVSNKSFIGEISGADLHDRLPGSLAAMVIACQHGARWFRVHHVKESLQAIRVAEALI